MAILVAPIARSLDSCKGHSYTEGYDKLFAKKKLTSASFRFISSISFRNFAFSISFFFLLSSFISAANLLCSSSSSSSLSLLSTSFFLSAFLSLGMKLGLTKIVFPELCLAVIGHALSAKIPIYKPIKSKNRKKLLTNSFDGMVQSEQ